MANGSWNMVKTWLSGSVYVAANRLGLYYWGFRPRFAPGEGFPQSVAAGDPTPTGAVIWTRVDPSVARGLRAGNLPPERVEWMMQVSRPNADNRGNPPISSTCSHSPLQPNPWAGRTWRHVLAQAIRSGRFVLFEVALDGEFEQPVLKGFAPICADFDNVVKVDLDGRLHPWTTYYYRFITKDGRVSRPGRFKTLPSDGEALASLRLGYVTCADYTNGYYHAYRCLADEEVDLVLHLGDYIYESVADAKFQDPLPDRALHLPSGHLKATTLADYRYLYQTYRTDADLQALHERHAMVAIWDDHEFANDGYGDVAPDDALEADGDRRQAATQAWLEYMPVRVPLSADNNAFRVYRCFRVGNLAEFILTDERLYRSAHPCGSKVMGERYMTPGCPQMFSPSQSMLGAGVCNQREWFLDCVVHSPAVWKVWLNEVHFAQLKLLGLYWNLDAWDGYAAERDWLLRRIEAARVKNFVVLTGDMHVFEASLIPSHFSPIRPGKTLGVELMTGSVTSANLKETVEQALFSRPARGLPFPPAVTETLIQHVWKPLQEWSDEYVDQFLHQVTRVIYRENPWIRWFDPTEHGYCILELTPERLTWTAYSVGDIRQPRNADKRILCQCEVPAGRPSLRIL